MSNLKSWSTLQPYNSDMTKICKDAREQIEKRIGKKFDVYVPLIFAIETELEHHYNVKVDVGGPVCFHAVIYSPGSGQNVNVEEVTYPKDVYDPLT